jgi:hypothetical protein
MGKKYHIYDAKGNSIKDPSSTAATYATANHSTALGVKNIENLRATFDWLRNSKIRIEALVIETHGTPGAIYFGDETLTISNVDGWLAGRGYEELFENGARVFLNGCNVAEGENGVGFLRMLGNIFFKKSYGAIGGSTSWGLPFFNGKIYHLWGDTVRLYYQGGKVYAVEGVTDSNAWA